MGTETENAVAAVFPRNRASTEATHMPFFDGTTLVYCRASGISERTFVSQGSIWNTLKRNTALTERFKDLQRVQKIPYRAWKIAYCGWADRRGGRIETGLPEGAIECSPSFYEEGGQVHLSFIGGMPTRQGISYRMYTASGRSLRELNPAKLAGKETLFTGFLGPNHICTALKNSFLVKEKSTNRQFTFRSTFNGILRLSYLAESPHKLLITGTVPGRPGQTVMFDLNSKQVKEVQVGGSIYKSSIHKDRVIFAKKIGDGFENRDLFEGPMKLVPTDIQITQEAV